MTTRTIASISLIFLFILISAPGKTQIAVGEKAPVFTALDDHNNKWEINNYLGKKMIVVYFYPAAMTGGCTKQACGYRDNQEELKALNTLVVGISGDEVINLKYFKEAHNLNFPLLSDPEGNIANMFGVSIKDGASIVRNIDGEDKTLERGVTTSRWTFIIDDKGEIAYVNKDVNAEKDSETVISIIKSM